MLENQRAECRFSILSVVFFVLCACRFAYSLVSYLFNISVWLLWGGEVFKGSLKLKFLHAMFSLRYHTISEGFFLS